ncbi:hypothetical protein HYW94_04430 [Candidatus Uhrbacteria bacterium]|nr:hypothetical protein [Candidatus Uhrbacteria bacterium]
MMKENGDSIPKTKGDERAKRRRKDQFEPTGGGFSAQAKRAEVNRQYEGVPEVLRPKVRVHLPGEKEKYLEREEQKKQDKKKKKR